jgi:hypothetical protein
MRPFLAAILLVAAIVPPPARSASRRESVERVAPLLAGLRAARVPGPLGRGPERRYVVVDALTPARRAVLEAAGLTIELPAPGAPAPRWRDGVVVQGIADARAAAAIGALPFVRRLDRPGTPWTNAGSVEAAADSLLATAAARAVLGTDGAGVTVGVISDGADDRAASIASGDLPADLELLGAGSGNEGTAMLEVVHDLAPGARLLFAPVATSAAMVAAIDALAAAGAQVIVDDLVFTDEPKFEDGPIAAAARRFAAGGGVYVTAAGNFGRTHWIGDFRRGTGRTFQDTAYRGLQLFGSGDAGNSIRVPAGGELLAVLQWNEPFGAATNDFDLVLARPHPDGDEVLAAGAHVQADTHDPIESLRWSNDTGSAFDVYLAIAEFARARPGVRLNLIVFTRPLLKLQHAVRREGVFGHAAVAEVLSVAAAAAGSPGSVRDYSARGPATILFPAREVRPAPSLTGVDGISTAVGARGSFPQPFLGTSAAAPEGAGCAALLLAGGVPAANAVAAMLATAADIGARGRDVSSGAGRLDCAAAARLATGIARAPAVGGMAAHFRPDATLEVVALGSDPDADVRSATVRILDARDRLLDDRRITLAPTGPAFDILLDRRGVALSDARRATVEVVDAVGLSSGVAETTIECPEDDSVGDAFCALGELTEPLAALRDRRPRRLVKRAARALLAAGKATARRRQRAARRAVGRAARQLGRVERLVGAAPDLAAAVNVLRARLGTLRASLR